MSTSLKSLEVQKRGENRFQEFKLDKLRYRLFRLTSGEGFEKMNLNVILNRVIPQVTNKMSTKTLDLLLVRECIQLSLSCPEPQYAHLYRTIAVRLVVSYLQKAKKLDKTAKRVSDLIATLDTDQMESLFIFIERSQENDESSLSLQMIVESMMNGSALSSPDSPVFVATKYVLGSKLETQEDKEIFAAIEQVEEEYKERPVIVSSGMTNEESVLLSCLKSY